MSPEVLIGSPVTSLIHSKHSAANSSLYFELICKRKKRGWIKSQIRRGLLIEPTEAIAQEKLQKDD